MGSRIIQDRSGQNLLLYKGEQEDHRRVSKVDSRDPLQANRFGRIQVGADHCISFSMIVRLINLGIQQQCIQKYHDSSGSLSLNKHRFQESFEIDVSVTIQIHIC
jgi:hypothetical protein